MADQAEPVVPDLPAAPDPTQAATPAAATPPTSASPAPDTPWAGSPWAGRLDEIAATNQQLTPAQVHELWQSEVQPYVTRREQELGEGASFIADLQDDEKSIGTYLAFAEQNYGPEVAEAIANAIVQHVEGAAAAPPEGSDTSDDYETWLAEQPPWIQEREALLRGQEEDQEYNAEVQQYAPDVIADGAEHLFARYVLASEGDVQEAKALYDQEMGPIVAAAKQNPALAASIGLAFAEPADQTEAPPEGAPHVLGATGSSGGAAPPTTPQYGSMDEVYSDFFDSVKGRQPGELLPDFG